MRNSSALPEGRIWITSPDANDTRGPSVRSTLRDAARTTAPTPPAAVPGSAARPPRAENSRISVDEVNRAGNRPNNSIEREPPLARRRQHRQNRQHRVARRQRPQRPSAAHHVRPEQESAIRLPAANRGPALGARPPAFPRSHMATRSASSARAPDASAPRSIASLQLTGTTTASAPRNSATIMPTRSPGRTATPPVAVDAEDQRTVAVAVGRDDRVDRRPRAAARAIAASVAASIFSVSIGTKVSLRPAGIDLRAEVRAAVEPADRGRPRSAGSRARACLSSGRPAKKSLVTARVFALGAPSASGSAGGALAARPPRRTWIPSNACAIYTLADLPDSLLNRTPRASSATRPREVFSL